MFGVITANYLAGIDTKHHHGSRAVFQEGDFTNKFDLGILKFYLCQ